MRTPTIIVSLLFAALGICAAHAHAFLDHASPLVGSTVPRAPREVSLSFTQNLEPAFSSLEVTGPGGARVEAGKAQIGGNTMRVPLRGAGPGAYHVRWRALSVDTHRTQGSFTFQVGGK